MGQFEISVLCQFDKFWHDGFVTTGKGKRPRDTNQLAKWIVDRSTGQIPEEPAKPAHEPGSISEYMATIGRKGGQIGGKRRLKTMTKAERSKIATKAARSRWKKARPSH